MNKSELITNQVAMLLGLVGTALLALVLGAALRLTSPERGYEIIFFAANWFQASWIIVVAVRLNILGLAKHRKVVTWAAIVCVGASSFFSFGSFRPEAETLHDNALGLLVPLLALVTLTLAAQISVRISKDILTTVLNFVWIVNWPIFLIVVAPSLRAEMAKVQV